MNLCVAEASLLDQPMVANERRLARDNRFGTAAGDRLELRTLCQATPYSTARARIARPTGCSDRASSPAAISRISRDAVPFSGITSTTCGAPFVRVPVLSNATQRTAPASFEMNAALDQHALPRRGSNRRDHRHGRGNHERARTGNHQQHERAIKPRTERLAHDRSGGDQRQSPIATANDGRACSIARIARRTPETAHAVTAPPRPRAMMRASVVSCRRCVTRMSSAP